MAAKGPEVRINIKVVEEMRERLSISQGAIETMGDLPDHELSRLKRKADRRGEVVIRRETLKRLAHGFWQSMRAQIVVRE